MPNWTWNELTAPKKVIKSLMDNNGNFSFNNLIPIPEELEKTTSGGRVNELIALYILENFTLKEFREYWNKWNLYLGPNLSKNSTKKEIKKKLEERLDGRRTDEVMHGFGKDATIVASLTGEDYFKMHEKYGYHDWYDAHMHKWGVKWDASSVSAKEYSEISNEEWETSVGFNTPWDMPYKIFEELCSKFPSEEIRIVSEYEDNQLVIASNHEGSFEIDGEYSKIIPDDFDWDNWSEIPWTNINTGEELYTA